MPSRFAVFPVTDRRQGGVITNAAVMTMTSNPLRTQPITRGAWLAGVIFNDPPDPAPANVPPLPLEEDTGAAGGLTLAGALRGASYAGGMRGLPCPARSVGFCPWRTTVQPGVWRDTYDNGSAVDASGVLFGRHKFTHIGEFKDAILAEKDRFARAFAAHLLAFALGREGRPVGRADAGSQSCGKPQAPVTESSR